MTDDVKLSLVDVRKSFGQVEVMKGVTLDVERGQMVCLSDSRDPVNRPCCAV